MRRKRGQQNSGGSAAALVAVVGLIIVLYIIFLPPDERVALLEGTDSDDDDDTNGDSTEIEKNLTLLLEMPGRLDFLESHDYDHPLPPVYLYRSSDSEQLKQVGSLQVRNGAFQKAFPHFEFSVSKPEMTSNVLIAFSAPKNDGTLTITLNGRTIFSEDIESANPVTIPIDNQYLQRSNILAFELSGVGWNFWRTNEYVLSDIHIVGHVEDVSRQKSINIFQVKGVEYNNMEDARLVFNPECQPAEVGVLEVRLNNQIVYSAIPDCGSTNPVDMSPHVFVEGENTLAFKTERGNYLIDNIEIRTELSEEDYPSYYFDVNDSLYREIRAGIIDARVRMDFFDDRDLKQGRIFVNDRISGFSTRDKNFTKSISALIESGNNGIKIEPDRTLLDIRKLKVFVEERD
ncbi:MAG: hypothetical protein ABIC95_05785 [archaeon]